MDSLTLLKTHWVAATASSILLYSVVVVIYRLFLSPLSKFPGPKLAAATLLYEAYYDVILGGQYTFKIKELHEQYGPIVRISPYELHVNDPEYHEYLYSQKSPRNKYKYFTDQFGIPLSTFSSIDHRLHRIRRQPEAIFFSKQSIYRLEFVISEMIEKLCQRIEGFLESGKPMPMHLSYRCMTTDVVTLYSFNKSWDFLDHEDFNPRWHRMIKANGDVHLIKHFPFIMPLVQSLPDPIVKAVDYLLDSDLMLIMNWQKDMKREITRVIDIAKGRIMEEGRLPRTIFESLLESNLPEKEKSFDRLWQESLLVVGAGADTTANVCAQLTFHLLSNPDKLATLKKELEEAIPDPYEPVKLTVVEHLPYLSAVIQEAIRMAYGVATRLQRVAPDEDMQYHQYSIPRGTPVGMSAVLMHHNESIFPNSWTFLPERWLGEEGKAKEKYMIAFSRGTRQCMGMNLSRAELYMAIATIFRRYDMELYDTIRERDINVAYDGFLPQPSRGNKGVRVIFKNKV